MTKKPKNSPLFEAMFGNGKEQPRVVSYDCIDPILLGRLVVAVVDSGCAVLFGCTRDKGAWAITFMGDPIPNNRQTDYCGDPDTVSTWLLGWVEQWEGVVEELKGPQT